MLHLFLYITLLPYLRTSSDAPCANLFQTLKVDCSISVVQRSILQVTQYILSSSTLPVIEPKRYKCLVAWPFTPEFGCRLCPLGDRSGMELPKKTRNAQI